MRLCDLMKLTNSSMHRLYAVFCRCTTKVQAWGEPVDFTPAKVTQSEPAAKGLQKVVLDVGPLASGYTTPGQYMQVRGSTCSAVQADAGQYMLGAAQSKPYFNHRSNNFHMSQPKTEHTSFTLR